MALNPHSFSSSGGKVDGPLWTWSSLDLVKKVGQNPIPERQFENRHQKYKLNVGLPHAFSLLGREYLKRPALVLIDFQVTSVRS